MFVKKLLKLWRKFAAKLSGQIQEPSFRFDRQGQLYRATVGVQKLNTELGFGPIDF
jgi:hypothetical protein